MREIEFRGMSTLDEAELSERLIEHNGKWIHGTPIEDYIVNGIVEVNDEYIAMKQWVSVDPETISQYTGLKDKNGQKIFEGDILQIESEFVGSENAEVHYTEDYMELCAGRWILHRIRHAAEVIGNKWENPELLEVE